MMKSVVLFMALGIAFLAPALAQSPNPAPSSTDIQCTAHDVTALMKATKDAETSPNVTINVVGKDPLDMPIYDPIVHYVGVDAKSGAATI
jgi:hypothetical protein